MSDPSQTVSSRSSYIRAWTYALLEEGDLTSTLSRIVEALLILLIIANVAAVALETIPSYSARYHDLFASFEKISVAAYTVEYLLRIWSSIEDPRIAARGPIKGRISFSLRPLMIIDFLAFAPSYLSFVLPIDLRVLRIFRLFRLVKLARYSQALPALLGVLYAERSALFASSVLLLSTVFIAGAVMHVVEGTINPSSFGTLPDGMYWAITTLTTVGYGDVTPHTPVGKFVAGITMVIGLALFALPVGIIANGFVNGLNRRRFAVTWSILKQQPLFQGFGVEALSDILDCVAADIVREQGHLAIAGEPAHALFLVVQGIATEEMEDDIHELGPGDLIGAQALRYQGVYARTVTAREDVRVLSIGHDDLRRLARKNPLLRERIEDIIEREAHEAGTFMSDADRIKELEAENARLHKALADLVSAKLTQGAASREPVPGE